MNARFSFTAGILLCGEIRDFLKECNFKGMNISFIESSGWIERTFHIKGESSDIKKVMGLLNKWGKENNLF